MKTRVHELLGVEVDEVFGVKNWDCEYRVADYGELFNDNGEVMGSTQLAHLINDHFLIIRKPKSLTDEQRKVLEALEHLNLPWVALDEDGTCNAFYNKPELNGAEWLPCPRFSSLFELSKPFRKILAPLLPDWTVALDVRRALGRCADGQD